MAVFELADLLGKKLQGDGGEVETSSLSGSGRYVGIYFSAHWCPPCRMFTPELVKFYDAFTKKDENKGKLEIVFVSSDQSQQQFDDYFKDMPWKCVPFVDRGRKQNLCEKFGVKGIPTLIIINSETGEVVCSKARERVMDDSDGDDFPWNS